MMRWVYISGQGELEGTHSDCRLSLSHEEGTLPLRSALWLTSIFWRAGKPCDHESGRLPSMLLSVRVRELRAGNAPWEDHASGREPVMPLLYRLSACSFWNLRQAVSHQC